MNEQIFSIRDKVSGLFGLPFIAHNQGVACRMFNEFCSKAYSPDSYELYCLGTFDTEQGIISSVEKPVFVCSAVLKEVK